MTKHDKKFAEFIGGELFKMWISGTMISVGMTDYKTGKRKIEVEYYDE